MHKATLGGLFGAMWDFIKSSWYVIIGSVVAVVVIFGALLFTTVGFGPQTAEPSPAQAGLIFLLVFLFLPLFVGSQLIAWRHAYVRGETSVLGDIGWALGAGFTAAFSMLVVGIAVVIVMWIVLAILSLIAVAIFGAAGGFGPTAFTDPAASAGLGGGLIALLAIFYILFYGAYFWFYGRLIAAGPVMAAQRSFNPFSALAQSWRQTGRSQWTILGIQLLVLVAVIAIVAAIALAGGAGAAASDPTEASNTASLLIIIFVYPPMLLYSVALPYAVYRETGDHSAESSDIFA
jgi:hypothetical protein